MSAMTPLEVERRLKVWREHIVAVEAAYDALYALTKASPESSLCAPSSALSNAYTEAVAEIVGDSKEWLIWWWLEARMGKHRLLTDSVQVRGLRVKVGSLRALARVIVETREP